jgi:hypothetical protein
MVDKISSQSELAFLCRGTADAVNRRRIVCRHIVRVFIAQLRPKGNRTSQPEIKPNQVLGVASLIAGPLPFEIVDVLVADVQRAMVMVELVLNVIDDCLVRSEAMRRQGITLRSIGPGDEGRAGNLTGVGANIGIGAIADARTQQVT